MNINELKKKIGLKKGQLLTCGSGILADLLDVRNNVAYLGILATGKVVEVSVDNLIRK
jgi:hypothetical protein